jgi:sugar lactone lactonase YvrE
LANTCPPPDLFIEARHPLGESIIWHEASGLLFWIDLLEPALFDTPPGEPSFRRRPLPLPPPIGSIAATTDPKRLMLAHRGGLSLLHIDTLALEAFADPEGGRDAIIYNDMKCDRWGRLWVGTSHQKEIEARGALWCVKDRRTWALGDAGFPVSNGPAFSLDGRIMYFNDSAGRRTFAYDIAEGDLLPRNRRLLRSYTDDEGMPDGLVVDSEGGIWSAQWGGASTFRLSPEGQVLARIPVPAGNVTTLCFAGPDLKDVYITTARDALSTATLGTYSLTGSVFRMKSNVSGLPEPLFPI